MAASQSDSIYSVFSLIERSRPKISTAAMKQPAPKSSTAGIKGVFLSLREDVDRARDRFQVITKDLPAATGRYCLQKVPVVSAPIWNVTVTVTCYTWLRTVLTQYITIGFMDNEVSRAPALRDDFVTNERSATLLDGWSMISSPGLQSESF